MRAFRSVSAGLLVAFGVVGAVSTAAAQAPSDTGSASLMSATFIARDWPAAVRFTTGPYVGEVIPYARLGTADDSLRAGAMLRYGPGTRDSRIVARLGQMGVRDGAAFGDAGRWYLFAAASGRAIGMNMARYPDGDPGKTGWSTDTAAEVGDAQVGVGWRQGPMQTSIGYLHRTFEPRNPMPRTDFVKDDEMLALSISIKPQR